MAQKVTTKDLREKANSLGYEVLGVTHASYGSRLSIVPVDRQGYTPELYHYDEDFSFGKEEFFPHWRVQTTSYGALKVDETKKVMVQIQNAIEMAEFLNSIDIGQLEAYRLEY